MFASKININALYEMETWGMFKNNTGPHKTVTVGS
jgi:hypothetical protein